MEENPIIHVQNYLVSYYDDVITYNIPIYIEDTTKLTNAEILEEARSHLDPLFPTQDLGYNDADLEIKTTQFELPNHKYYTAESIALNNFDAIHKDASGNTFILQDLLKSETKTGFDIRFKRYWENGLIEEIEDHVEWGTTFSFTDCDVLEVLQKATG